jgi:hypothetical protein
LRFAHWRAWAFDSLSANAYRMYLIHYVFAVWLQYARLGTGLFAIGKAAIVFGGTLIMSWSIAAAMGARCRLATERDDAGCAAHEDRIDIAQKVIEPQQHAPGFHPRISKSVS